MIIDETKLKSYGLPIGGEIQNARLLSAIREAEMAIVKQMIGDDNYRMLSSLAATAPERQGGDITIPGSTDVRTVAGSDAAISYIAMACLLRHDIHATTFGSVKKNDQHSMNVETWDGCRYYYTVGELWIKELCDAKGWNFSRENNFFRKII